jgi:hypothetical protein
VPAPARAQDPIKDEIIAVRARRIETVSDGVVENGVVLIRNGKISLVGKTVKIPVGAQILNADTVMPGIVAAYSQIGLSAPGGGGPPIQLPPNIPPQFAARFAGGGGRAAANTHYRVLDELYPFEPAYERLTRAGVTTLALVPDGRGFTGQGAVVKTGGERMGATPEKLALAQTSPLAINFAQDTQTQDLIRTTLQGGSGGGGGGGGRFGGGGGGGAFDPAIEAENQALASGDDDFQGRRGGQFNRGGGGPPVAQSSFTLQARRAPVTKAVAGETPTFISCSDSAAVIYALPLFQAFDKLKPVYILPGECYRLADQLGQKKASVILTADLTFEPNTRNRVNPAAVLSKAGVKVACRPSSDSVTGYEGLFMKMAELMKSGLDRETALKAITLHPAEMLGLKDRVGTIEMGRDANLILLDGDPFSALTKISRVLIEGKAVYDGK